MVDTLRSYGVNEQEVAADDLSAHAERIRLAGYSVLASVFTARDTADLAARLDEVLRRQTLREFPDDPEHRPLGDVLHGRLKRHGGTDGTTPQKSAADELAKLHELHEAGAIDDEQFERGKHLVLS